MRRAWNLPDKRAVLSSVANLMLCGTADVHPDFDGCLARSRLRVDVGGGDSVSNRGGGRGGVGAAGVAEKSRLVSLLVGLFVR